jgi:hypothetical protein
VYTDSRTAACAHIFVVLMFLVIRDRSCYLGRSFVSLLDDFSLQICSRAENLSGMDGFRLVEISRIEFEVTVLARKASTHVFSVKFRESPGR